MLTCLAKISLPACGRRCVLELKKAVLGGQSGVQAVLRALRRFSSDFRAFLVVFPRFSPDIGCRRAGSLVRGHRGRLPAAEMLETCWTLIALLNVASTVPTLWEILSGWCGRAGSARASAGRAARRALERRVQGVGVGVTTHYKLGVTTHMHTHHTHNPISAIKITFAERRIKNIKKNHLNQRTRSTRVRLKR